VNARGVPVQLRGTGYEDDYWASVVLLHLMRDVDAKLGAKGIVKKFPHGASRKIVEAGWR
jgi:hypothetical protein